MSAAAFRAEPLDNVIGGGGSEALGQRERGERKMIQAIGGVASLAIEVRVHIAIVGPWGGMLTLR